MLLTNLTFNTKWFKRLTSQAPKVIKDMEDQYEHVFLDLENEVQTQIQTLLSFKLDNQLITSIEHAARQLDHILQGKEGRTYDEIEYY